VSETKELLIKYRKSLMDRVAILQELAEAYLRLSTHIHFGDKVGVLEKRAQVINERVTLLAEIQGLEVAIDSLT